ncbi:4Fe-4S dicluster domain-containing protein [Leisingera daeponensis]|uniref:4Fe-4S dicluster domain-containing protein n=1 Tax=Leisingera daeponensis TaxID=405746 RepID=UPI0021BD4EF7|nr:4Fe-4S binding protein [Leisingera daeponensis]
MRDVASRSSTLPLMPLCQAAHSRKLETGRAQILALYEVEPHGLEDAGALHSDVVPVAVCRLEKITHADLLHALAGGFDVIYLKACTAPKGLEQQSLEVELVQALGGLGRILLFDGAAGVDRQLAARLLPFPSVAPEVLAVGSRRDTARASAAALLPPSIGHVALPEQAPYGTLDLCGDLCTHCNSCVWVCPSDALSLTESGSEISFTGSLCFQCGLCVSICPPRALNLAPGMDLTVHAELPHLLEGPEGPDAGTMAPAEGRFSDGSGAAVFDQAGEAALPFEETGFSPVQESRRTGRV